MSRLSRRYRRPTVDLYEGSNISFALSFLDLITILLTFFIFLDSKRIHSADRQSNVLSSLAQSFSTKPKELQTPAKTTSRENMRAETIMRTAQNAGFEVTQKNAQFTILLPSAELFDSGDDLIKASVVGSIERIADVIKHLKLSVQIEGHTDTQPISNNRFRSNWELSSARAVSVLKIFMARGVPAQHLSAAGRGEFRPVASNETEVGRAANRRIVITITSPKLAGGPT